MPHEWRDAVTASARVVDLGGRHRVGDDRGLLAGRGERPCGDGEHLSMKPSLIGTSELAVRRTSQPFTSPSQDAPQPVC